MPLEIKSKDQKKVYGVGIVGDCTNCGFCDNIILNGHSFWMLDEPYNCLVHEQCLRFFPFDGKPRSGAAKHRTDMREALSTDEETVAQYMERKHFKTCVPTLVRDAWRRVYAQAILLRRHYS